MSALEEAFARVGINGYGMRQVGRQLQPAKFVPDPSIPPENRGISTTRERLLATLAEVTAMSDHQLSIEMIALEENAEAIRVELRGLREEPGLHEVGWQRRAERALAGIKARLALCAKEQERRRRQAAELARGREAERHAGRRAEHERLLAEQLELKAAKQAAVAAAAALHDTENAVAFVRHARVLLPHETCLAIWVAVNAERAS